MDAWLHCSQPASWNRTLFCDQLTSMTSTQTIHEKPLGNDPNLEATHLSPQEAFGDSLPQAIVAPVSESQRVRLIDALRGVALLGILLMNIPVFSMAQYASEAYRNDPTNVNYWVSAVITVFFEGKMRALFGMIFGAGIVLFVSKKEQAGKPVAGLFYRRMLWLLPFGLFHAHVILWIGDILYLYGICGMLVFLFRKVSPKYLVMAVPLVAILDFTSSTLLYQYVRNERIAYVSAMAVQEEGKPLTETQQKDIEDWQNLEELFIPNREMAAENTRKMKSDYATVAAFLRPKAFELETRLVLVQIWDSIALMLLGIALYQWGFLTGQWTQKSYWKTLLIGYGIGLPLVAFSFYYTHTQYPNLESMLASMEKVSIQWVNLIYPFQRILLVLAHISGLVLLYQSGVCRRLFQSLMAVGQMAFTNYIMHSIACTLFFFGYGLNFYAELEYYQIFFVVFAIWCVQLIYSPIWLRYFHFGPLEWMWRSLTYWRIQPLVRRNG